MMQEFHSMRRLPPYVFAEVNSLMARARTAGEDIIDFGMGNPDLPTPPHIVEKLIETAQKPGTNRYSASRGIPGLRRALAGYYKRRFDVDLDMVRPGRVRWPLHGPIQAAPDQDGQPVRQCGIVPGRRAVS